MEIIFTWFCKIASTSHFLLKALTACLIFSFQHMINKLDFGLLVNLNIISNHSKYPFQRSKGLPKTVRWQAEQVQIRVQSAGGHKATPLAFNYLTIYIVMFQRQQTIEQPNCINFQQLICLTLVFDHNNLVKPT